jgi:type IV fimbrial biogenesis protein FimT
MVFNRSTSMKSQHTQSGFTLVEVAVVAAIAAIAAASAAPGMRALVDQRRLDGVATRLAADLQLARNEAIARNVPVRWSWHAASGCYVIHTGQSAQCTCTAGGPAMCGGDAVQIGTARWSASDRLALQSNTASIAFDPLHGTASPAATLRVTGADGRAIHHVVNVMGRVRSCSPAGAVPGHRPC